MVAFAGNGPITLDVTTLFVVAVCVTALLGILLLVAWAQDRIRALAWWGTAYLIGGGSVVIWSFESHISPPLPAGTANAMVFIACGMMWNAARLFHGRPVLWGAMVAGATVWLAACFAPDFVQSTTSRVVLSSLIVSFYTFLTAAELWRERRKHLLRRWPAIFVPVLHGLVFLCPIPLAGVMPHDAGFAVLAGGWIAVFTLEVMLYVVGTAFIVLVLSKERSVRLHKDAAFTDELTGVLNRRGFVSAARQMIERFAKKREPVSVLVFDLDHFKSINDRYGHAMGDQALRLFASVSSGNLRATDILGRFGGEEFVAILPGTAVEAAIAAERVRACFEATGAFVGDRPLRATVSIGVASGEFGADVMALIEVADKALYAAKTNGRNRVAVAKELAPASPSRSGVSAAAPPHAPAQVPAA
ncbi:MAG: GGDEF domain-containing protein [Hyphomicrobiales bacterium]|nr:GGDEF domain-containing protein [Hyphomicrobiales bacterium]